MDGTVEVTVFPEPFKAAAPILRTNEAILLRGRVDDGDKGRVILADDIRLLEQALADGQARPRGAVAGEPNACRIRAPGATGPPGALGQLKRLCAEHPGRVPLFLHLLVDRQEVVIRARGLSVDASPEFVAAAETLLGAGAVTVEYAGRA